MKFIVENEESSFKKVLDNAACWNQLYRLLDVSAEEMQRKTEVKTGVKKKLMLKYAERKAQINKG